MDLLADAGHCAGPALGPHRGRKRRRHLAGRPDGRSDGPGLSGRPVGRHVDGGLHQAFRRLRRRGRRAGLQQHVPDGTPAAECVPPAFRGGREGRRADADDLLQRQRRRPLHGQCLPRERRPPRRMGLRRPRGHRLEFHGGDDQPRFRRGPQGRGPEVAGRRRRHGHDDLRLPVAPGRTGAQRGRQGIRYRPGRAQHPAREDPPGPVREPVCGREGRRGGPVRTGASGGGAEDRRRIGHPAQERRRAAPEGRCRPQHPGDGSDGRCAARPAGHLGL